MKSLHCRLTFLYTITSSLVLAIAMTGFLMLRIRETQQAQIDNFYAVWNALSFRLRSDTLISQSFLAQTEASSHSIIHIEENNIPLKYSGSWQPQTDRQLLISQAKSLAENQGISSALTPISAISNDSSLLSFEGNHQDKYYAMVMVYSHKKTTRSLCLISYRPPVILTLQKSFALLCGLELTGTLCLALISWHFVGWSLKPTEESQKKQAEFIAAASHELRSPLAVLRSGIAAVLAAPDEKTALLRTMDSECARMSRLIDDLLILASTDTKTWGIRLQKTDMDTLLIETYEAFSPVCQKKQITLHLELPELPLPLFTVDPERIRQVLSILLDNALSHAGSNQEIRICAKLIQPKRKRYNDKTDRTFPSYLLLQVKDQGPGIPDDIKPHVFERFYRADKARSGKNHFGLGLSIARELVLLHKGNITVTDNPGGGSCFSVILPLHELP